MLRSSLRLVQPAVDLMPKRWRQRKILTWPVDYLPFKWSYPKKSNFFVDSGDKADLDKSNLHLRPRGDFALLPEYHDAPEEIKKLFSVAFGGLFEEMRSLEREFVEPYKRHALDTKSPEFLIAQKTFKVRDSKDRYNAATKRSARLRLRWHSSIHRRNKLLKNLGRQSLERYNYLKEVLQIEHTPPPLGECPEPKTRKGDLRKKTAEWAENVKAKKIEECHERMKKLQVEFEVEKKETEAWIAKEIEELKLTDEEIKSLEYKGIFD